MANNTFTNGSEWRKWDLQVQPTKAEWLTKQQESKLKIQNATREYLKYAISKHIKAISITDHNCGMAIDSAFELVQKENLNIYILPGVEIDINAGYQMLVILNPIYKEKIGVKTWNDTILHFLNNVCSLAKPVFDNNGAAKAIGGDINDVLSRICKEDIGIPFFAHCQSEKGLFQNTSGAIRKDFFKNMVGGKYYFALDHKTDEEIKKTQEKIQKWGFKSNKFALIKTSDAHCASEVGEIFTWIKSDPTYEGLKQIIYDPKSRVAVQEREPVKPTNAISSFKLDIPKDATISVLQTDGTQKDDKFCFTDMQETFSLNPYFNCFIGGRGSGKSTILNFFGQHSKDPNSSVKFWEKIKPSFNVKDRNVFAFEGSPIFEFIGQSEIESFATNTQAFTNAIYERANVLSDGRLENAKDKLASLLRMLRSFQTSIKDFDHLVDNQKSKEDERAILENAIQLTKSQEYSEIVANITKKSNQKQGLKKWRSSIDELMSSLQELHKRHFKFEETEGKSGAHNDEQAIVSLYQEAHKEAKLKIEAAIKALDDNKFKELIEKENSLSQEVEDHEEELSQLLKNAGLSDENVLQVRSAPQKLVSIESEIQQISDKIDDKQKEISNYEGVLSSVRQAKTEYENAIRKSIEPLVELLEKQALENEKKDVKNIGLKYFFNEVYAWEQIAKDFYNTFPEYQRNGDRPVYIQRYLVDNRTAFSGDQKTVNELLLNEDANIGYIKFLKAVFKRNTSFQIFRAIRDHHLHDVAQYKRIQVLYDNKDIENASFGQKCTAVMVILLLFGNYPLIIDEPEAHLDSSLIANYLVPLIKQKKNSRQILFATHNANFVINGDAEKIFILKNETGKTEIIETTIENLDNRNELLRLEGGEEAFKKRGEKLHIQ